MKSDTDKDPNLPHRVASILAMKRTLLILVAVTLLVSSCATDIIPFATGGSRADGTVTLAYEYGSLQKPVIDWEEAENEALSVCRRWGYSEAEAFGGSKRSCVVASQYGCSVYSVTVEYQCSNDSEDTK